MDEIITLIQNVGFPIAIAVYLLVVFGAKIDRLSDAVEKLANLMESKV
ncbi:MAG: YvrJ family protein [Caldisericum sp.]